MIKVLQIVSSWGNGGVERYISEIQPYLSKNYICDILAIRGVINNSIFSDNILNNKGFITFIPEINRLSFFKRWVYRFNYVVNFCKENNYKIVHINGTTADALLYAYLIKKNCSNISVIVHCHGDNVDPPNVFIKTFIHYFTRFFFRNIPDYCLGCSKSSIHWMIGNNKLKTNKNKVIYCGIDIEKFQYSQIDREKFRVKFNCKDNFLIGTVGRFCEQKNPMYILKIIKELKNMTSDFKFIWVGSGEMKNEIQEKAKEMDINDYIIFTGIQKDVSAVYSALDVFILPSIYEGNPIVGFEAQASGLKCLFSDTIVKESKVTKNTKFLPILNKNVKDWAVEILNNKKKYDRDNTSSELISAGQDLKSCALELEKIYNSFV